LVVFYPSFYVLLKKTEIGSASGPVLFLKNVGNQTVDGSH